MKSLIIANWKMNPPALAQALRLARDAESVAKGLKSVEVIIAPPFPFLAGVGRVLKKTRLGAQDVFWGSAGPYTGAVSSRQLKEVGASYVIIGHSERRAHAGETDEMVNKKLRTVLENGMTGILCVGESGRSDSAAGSVMGQQLRTALKDIKKAHLKRLVVAYEPVWAISTNPNAVADTPDNAFRASLYIRKIVSDLFGRSAGNQIRVIYGGSVRAQNIASFLKEGKMQGALVGGASLDSSEFSNLLLNAAGRGKSQRRL